MKKKITIGVVKKTFAVQLPAIRITKSTFSFLQDHLYIVKGRGARYLSREGRAKYLPRPNGRATQLSKASCTPIYSVLTYQQLKWLVSRC